MLDRSRFTAGRPTSSALMLVGALVLARLAISLWGDALIFNNTLDFMAESRLSVVDLVLERYGVNWPQPASYPLLLKLLGATDP